MTYLVDGSIMLLDFRNLDLEIFLWSGLGTFFFDDFVLNLPQHPLPAEARIEVLQRTPFRHGFQEPYCGSPREPHVEQQQFQLLRVLRSE